MRRLKKNEILPAIKIEDVANDGRCVARAEGIVLFVRGCVPGDVCDIQVTKSRSGWAEACVIQILERSILRTDPFCSHFGECGGCKWQDLAYSSQLEFKHRMAKEAIRRIGKIEPKEIFPIMGSEKQQYYRNKLEFTFSNNPWLTKAELNLKNLNRLETGVVDANTSTALGFHVAFLFDKIVDVKHCYLQPEPSNEIRLAVKKFCDENAFTFFDLKKQTGFLRNLIIRTSLNGETMVIICFHEADQARIKLLCDFVMKEFPAITSLHYVVNKKGNDSIYDQELIHVAGRDSIEEEMEGLRFKISPKSFFQTNSTQALNLYKVVRDFAGLTGKELVYDLYTGTGSIALFLAAHAKKVVGIEQVEMAIEDARVNAALNQIDHVEFVAGDMKDALTNSFVEKHGMPDVVITDPPRAGMHEDVVKQLADMAPGRIVYISCNPATQARDLLLLNDQYEISKMQPVDMFPHTHHIENVLLLEKKKN